MSYNPEIHKRRSIRLKGYDYSKAGLYFITICCQNRRCLFGAIKNGKMIMNNFGIIAWSEWINTSEIRGNVDLLEFIIMPNHMHGIIKLSSRGGELLSPYLADHSHDLKSQSCMAAGELHSPSLADHSIDMKSQFTTRTGELHSPYLTNLSLSTHFHNAEKITLQSLNDNRIKSEFNSPPTTGEFNSRPHGTSQTVGAIVRGYKSSVTKQLNLLHVGYPVWQRNYYENIIRNERAYQNISKYIINNPYQWQKDKFHKG